MELAEWSDGLGSGIVALRLHAVMLRARAVEGSRTFRLHMVVSHTGLSPGRWFASSPYGDVADGGEEEDEEAVIVERRERLRDSLCPPLLFIHR